MSAMRVNSLFSGGGGLDMGFLLAGFNIGWAIDNKKSAVDTYRQNIGNHIVYEDINSISAPKLPTCEIVIGGPPCQSFSLAGNRKTNDVRSKLVWKYIDIIDHLNPIAFLFENVVGLLSIKNSDGDKVYPLLIETFKKLGYSLTAEVVNAVNFGVPQRRKRVIIVGIKGNTPYIFPAPTHGHLSSSNNKVVTVGDALDDLPDAVDDADSFVEYAKSANTDYQKEMRNGSTGVTEHFIPTMSELDKYIIRHVSPGGNYMDIPPDVPSERIRRLQRDGGHTTCYGRLDATCPSYTINTYFNRPNVGCNIHHRENRMITVREALRLQSFPDTYKIVSTSKQERNIIVGNAVPPKLAYSLAYALNQQIK